MEIIEKEKVKEVPVDYYDSKYNRHDVNGKANAGLALGIVGTALGAWALFGNRRANLFGGVGSGLGGANININGLETGVAGTTAPTAFQAWEKSCEEALALTQAIYGMKINTMEQMAGAREIDINEKFQLWKSQIDADFGLYKSTRDGFDALSAKQNADAFSLYKSQRDADDSIRKELSDLRAQVAINAAIRPYQDKLIQCEIDKAFTAGINYTDRKTCNVLYGQVVLPDTPTVTGYVGANQCGCPRVIAASTPAA